MGLSGLTKEGDEGYIGSSGKLLRSWQNQKNIVYMQGKIPDFWADPFVHFLRLKSSMNGELCVAML